MDVLPFSHFALFLYPRAWIKGYFTCFASILGVYRSLDDAMATAGLLGGWDGGHHPKKTSWGAPLDEMKLLDEFKG